MAQGVEEKVHPAVITVILEGVGRGVHPGDPGAWVSEDRGPVRMYTARVCGIVSMKIETPAEFVGEEVLKHLQLVQGWVAKGVPVCDGVLGEVDKDACPVSVTVIDGYEEGIVEERIDAVVRPCNTEPRKVSVRNVGVLRGDGRVEVR